MTLDGDIGAQAGLRLRKKAATREALRIAAYRLFDEKGFAQTSVDEIASAANVSRSTFFHYFGSKEALIFGENDDSGAMFVTKLGARPRAEPPLAAFEEALIEFAREASSDTRREEARLRERLLSRDVALQARDMQDREKWTERVAATFAERDRRPQPGHRDRLAARVCIAATAEVGDAWRTSESEPSAEAVIRHHFKVLRELLGG